MTSPTSRTLVLLGALTAFAPLSIDTYLPALPALGQAFATTQGRVQMSIGLFLLGLCLGMLVHGPLSDRYGRRPLLLGGIGLYLLATTGCLFATGIEQLLVCRFVQGFGGAAAAVLARAVVRDRYALGQAARVLSLMHLVTMLATLVAPLLGSVLLAGLGWRSIFVALWLFAAGCGLWAVFGLPESHRPEARKGGVGQAFAAYLEILRHGTALAYIGCMGLCFGGMFAFITASPFVYMGFYGVSPATYAVLFGLNIGGVIGVTVLGARGVLRHGPARLIAVGAAVAALASGGLLLCAASGLGGLPALVGCVMLYISVTGLLGANCVASLLALYPRQAGAAAGLAVASQFALGALFSALVGSLGNPTPLAMCTVMALGGLGCAACQRVVARAGRPGQYTQAG